MRERILAPGLLKMNPHPSAVAATAAAISQLPSSSSWGQQQRQMHGEGRDTSTHRAHLTRRGSARKRDRTTRTPTCLPRVPAIFGSALWTSTSLVAVMLDGAGVARIYWPIKIAATFATQLKSKLVFGDIIFVLGPQTFLKSGHWLCSGFSRAFLFSLYLDR